MEVRRQKGMKGRGKGFRILITFCILFLFWILLSGFFDAFHLIAGALCSTLVAFISHDLLMKGKGKKILLKTFKLLCFIPWELWQIVLSGIDVAYRVLHPQMPIDPRVIEFETSLRSDFALVTLGNSITLTPGTITISIDRGEGKFCVHALTEKNAEALLMDKTMQRKVADVYMEW